MSFPRIAVLLPCYNEAAAIGKTVDDFKKALPKSDIYVYDNGSTDDTIKVAKQHGAIVRSEFRQGKGNVVRRMFADIDADIYVLCDGDDTYEAAAVGRMIQKLRDEQLDMVVGKRVESEDKSKATYRVGHRLGNRLFNLFVKLFFSSTVCDIFSGYRVFTRRFVKSFPVMACGFDIEADLVIHSVDLKLPTGEVDTVYDERPEGSESKLSTYKDGFKILGRIFILLKDYKPLFFFSMIALLFVILGSIFLVPILSTYLKIGLVPKFPTLFAVVGVFVMAFISFVCGLILDNTAKMRRESKYLAYLALPAVIDHKE